MSTLLFILFAGLAIGSAIAVVAQRNPLYSAISLIGVFVALSCIYLTLAAPFIAAVQVIVYAGAIMVLVIFVIMLLNIEAEPRRQRLRFLVPTAVVLAAILIAEAAFILYSVHFSGYTPSATTSNVGLTASIGAGLFTKYLLPFEITSILLLMAIVGAMSLARRTVVLSAVARVVPGTQVLATNVIDSRARVDDTTAVQTNSTAEAERLLGVEFKTDQSERE